MPTHQKRKILVFQHVPFEPLGTLDPMLREAGFRIRYVNFARDPDQKPSLDGYSGLIILGGPMNVDQVSQYPNLRTEVALIQEALSRGMHVLGICLGAQLLAKAVGGQVVPGKTKEIGWYEVTRLEAASNDPLLKHFKNTETLFQWHGDQIELPENTCQLATSESCPIQAFSVGENAYGLQFHLEVDERLIERWLTVDINVEELATVADYIDPQQIRELIPQHLPAMRILAKKLFGSWIGQFAQRKRTQLKSR